MKPQKEKIRNLRDDLNNIISILVSTTGDITKLEYMDNYQAMRRVSFTLRKLRKNDLKKFEEELKLIRKLMEKKKELI